VGHDRRSDRRCGSDTADEHSGHAGDLFNIEVDANGAAKATLQDAMVTLGDGPDSVSHHGGTVIVIHAKEDDYKTDPAGNSGPRIACGVIER
jgi:superoxide dismutase, Cu-Zn family